MHRLPVIVAFLLLSALPVRAQSSPWTAWLYNPNGTMTRVSSDGSVVQDVTLPTVQGQAYPAQVAVSRGGQWAAYVTANPQLNASRLVIYNLPANNVLADYVFTDLLSTSLNFFAHPYVFNETDSTLAIGLAGSDSAWRILVLDVGSGATVGELRSDNPAVTALSVRTGAGSIPVIWYDQGGEIAFTMQQIDGAPGAEFGSYLWNRATGEVRENTLYPGLDNDLLPLTGEIVTPLRDPSLPNSDGAFVGGQQNTLQVFNASAGRRYPFHNRADRTFAAPRFIQNGERVLTAMADANGAITWSVVERSGEVVGELPVQIADVFSLVDGFIYLTASDPATLMVANTRDGLDAGVPVGQGAPGMRLQLAWAADAAAPPASAYAPWVDLSDAVSVAQVTQAAVVEVVPTATVEQVVIVPTELPIIPTQEEAPFYVAPTPSFLPTPSSFHSQLILGGRGYVTRAGHAAGLYTAPDSSAPAIILLYTDMIVEVLDGPNITDGYIWWKVRTVSDDPHQGWAIEGANGAAWLLPMP